MYPHKTEKTRQFKNSNLFDKQKKIYIYTVLTTNVTIVVKPIVFSRAEVDYQHFKPLANRMTKSQHCDLSKLYNKNIEKKKKPRQ